MHEHGKVIAIMATREGFNQQTEEKWKSQDFVLEMDGRYTRRVKFNLFGADKVDKANLQVGSIIDVDAEVEAHEYNGQWYNEIRVWNISAGGRSLLRD